MSIKPLLRAGLFRLESGFDRVCGRQANPLYHLGAMSWFFFWIVSATGLYLFIPYDTSAVRAWSSIQYITVEQWWLGGLVRSVHRYASDAMVVTMMLHLVREFALDRYHGARWFAWFTGVPLIWMVFSSGITGYWLVWDMLAQYLAIGTAEWLDWLGIFAQSIANNFLTADSLSDRFFTLLIFIHIAVPLFLLFAMWIHILRISNADVNPPRPLALGGALMLVVLSLAFPATSHPAADLDKATQLLHPDWFYMALYPVFDTWGPGTAWAAAIGLTVVVSALPWLRRRRRPQVARVEAVCNGCGNCAIDCPFGAIGIRDDKAVVQEAFCTGCGICVGSCPHSNPLRAAKGLTSGIELPDLTLAGLHARMVEAAGRLKGGGRTMVLGCDCGVDVGKLAGPSVAALSVPCTGMLPPSTVDYLVTRKLVDGVVVTGCRPGECFHRLGPDWTEERMAGARVPKLRGGVDRRRVLTAWAAPNDLRQLAAEIETFRRTLAETAP
jgi:ferredoxin/coenzyme F420-reducing hydrogenase delta subunit